MKKLLLAAVAAAGLSAATGHAAPLCTDLGFAGLFAKCNSAELPPLTVGAGQPLSADGPWALQSGAYYEVEIVADGSQELTLVGPKFFRAVWIDEIVINDLEVRPLGLDSLEFDDEGTIELGFIAIRPGQYELRIDGARGDSQKVQITIQ
ncbi:MAG: hypothetical protein AAF409_13790 [Pseudomonadota bacterium]